MLGTLGCLTITYKAPRILYDFLLSSVRRTANANRIMRKTLAAILWVTLALAGAWAYLTLAVRRGEPINSGYILVAAICSYAIGFRFYSKWIAAWVLVLNDRRATPCEVHEDGRDYV